MKLLAMLPMLFCLALPLQARDIPPDSQQILDNLIARLPSLPDQCREEAFDYDYGGCIMYSVVCDSRLCLRGWVHQTLFVIIEKDIYPTVEEALTTYLDFNSWEDGCREKCDPAVMRMNSSVLVDRDYGPDGIPTYSEQYLDFETFVTQGPIDLGWQEGISLTKFWRIPPVDGALMSTFFQVDTKRDYTSLRPLVPRATPAPPFKPAKGADFQHGVSSISDYNDYYWMITYDYSIRLQIDMLPDILATGLNESVLDIFKSTFDFDYVILDADRAVVIEYDYLQQGG